MSKPLDYCRPTDAPLGIGAPRTPSVGDLSAVIEMGTNERRPLSSRVAELSEASRERIVEAAGVNRVAEENKMQPRSHYDWGFARLPSLDYFYKVRREEPFRLSTKILVRLPIPTQRTPLCFASREIHACDASEFKCACSFCLWVPTFWESRIMRYRPNGTRLWPGRLSVKLRTRA